MPEIEASEKRQGLHLADFRSAAVESKENFLAGTPKMPAKCESQVSVRRIAEESWGKSGRKRALHLEDVDLSEPHRDPDHVSST